MTAARLSKPTPGSEFLVGARRRPRRAAAPTVSRIAFTLGPAGRTNRFAPFVPPGRRRRWRCGQDIGRQAANSATGGTHGERADYERSRSAPDAPHLCGNPDAAGRLATQVIGGGIEAVAPDTGSPVNEEQRVTRILGRPLAVEELFPSQ
jgi:hypothetical protein